MFFSLSEWLNSCLGLGYAAWLLCPGKLHTLGLLLYFLSTIISSNLVWQGNRTQNIGVVDSEYVVHEGLPTLGGTAGDKVLLFLLISTYFSKCIQSKRCWTALAQGLIFTSNILNGLFILFQAKSAPRQPNIRDEVRFSVDLQYLHSTLTKPLQGALVLNNFRTLFL